MTKANEIPEELKSAMLSGRVVLSYLAVAAIYGGGVLIGKLVHGWQWPVIVFLALTSVAGVIQSRR